MIDRDKLDDAVQARLATDTTHQVGMSDVPSQTPSVPYYILEQSPSPPPEGSLGDPEDQPYYDYLIKSVGKNHKETARASSRARWSMIKTPRLTISGASVVSVRTVSLGQIVRSQAPTLFEVNDIYRICLAEG